MGEKETSVKRAYRCIKCFENTKRDLRIKFKMLKPCVTGGDSFIHNVYAIQFDLDNWLFTYVSISILCSILLKCGCYKHAI